MRARTWALALAVAAVAAACGGGSGSPEQPVVFAAASLADVLERLDPDAVYSFAGSDELARQLREGAPADVYASATLRYVAELHADGVVGEPEVFATNRLVVIVPRDDPAEIHAVGDLARVGVRLVLAAPGVPAGDYARTALEALGLEAALANVVSEETDVTGVVGKVALGEADAGIVYATDARVAGDDVTVVGIPAAAQPTIEYAVATVGDADHPEAATAFVERLLSSEGQAALADAGFGVP